MSDVDFTQYQENPKGFVCDVLGGDPWEKQVEILNAVRDHERVTVRSCHAVGKTYVAGALVLWRLHCFRPSIVLTTAPGHRQVKDVLWRQIRVLQSRSRIELPGKVLETGIKINEDTFATGFATDEGDRFQGYHGRHLFIVVEEASGVPEAIFESIDTCLTTEGGCLLLIGNPTNPSGRFAASHKSVGWRKIRISAFDSPNLKSACLPTWAGQGLAEGSVLWPAPVRPELINVKRVVEMGDDYGVDSPFYAARVLWEFPDAGDDSLFPLSWIEAAEERWQNWFASEEAKKRLAVEMTGVLPSGAGALHSPSAGVLHRSGPEAGLPPVQIGADIARFGSCENVCCVRRGGVVTRMVGWMGQDLMATVGRIVALAREEDADLVTIDEIGLGAGVLDRLRELVRSGVLRARIVGVNVGARATDPVHYERLRDELYFRLRDRFRVGSIALSDERTGAQLAALRYGYTSAGKLQVESKDDLRERGVRSPDRADAVVLAFAPGGCGLLPVAVAGGARSGVPSLGGKPAGGTS